MSTLWLDERTKRELDELFPESPADRESRLAKERRTMELQERAKLVSGEIKRLEAFPGGSTA